MFGETNDVRISGARPATTGHSI